MCKLLHSLPIIIINYKDKWSTYSCTSWAESFSFVFIKLCADNKAIALTVNVNVKTKNQFSLSRLALRFWLCSISSANTRRVSILLLMKFSSLLRIANLELRWLFDLPSFGRELWRLLAPSCHLQGSVPSWKSYSCHVSSSLFANESRSSTIDWNIVAGVKHTSTMELHWLLTIERLATLSPTR